MNLPTFKYHPDPLATGSIKPSAATCKCCNQSRGFIYTGPVYCESDLDEQLCPWCIADGSAAQKFNATFTDSGGIGGYGEWDDVSDDIIAEVTQRTPGFSGWQQEQWWTHCQDAAAFLGRAGHKEITALGKQAEKAIKENSGITDAAEWKEFLAALDKDNSPTAYLFRCRKCGQIGGYQDAD